jgi:hypothetical protein
MAHHLAAAARVVVDAPIGRLERQTARSRARDDGMEAPSIVVDLDDVTGLDAL